MPGPAHEAHAGLGQHAGFAGQDGHDGHDKHAGHDPEAFRRLFSLSLTPSRSRRSHSTRWCRTASDTRFRGCQGREFVSPLFGNDGLRVPGTGVP